MVVALIVAISQNGVIGRRGAIPWRIRTDMRRFRRLTMGKPMIMGRKQYESVGKPLDGRDNIVITRNRAFCAPGILVAASLDEGLALAARLAAGRGVEETMIIGGAEIYRLAMPRVDRVYLSRVHADVDGDVLFDIDVAEGWRTTTSEYVPSGPDDEFAHTFEVLERVAQRR